MIAYVFRKSNSYDRGGFMDLIAVDKAWNIIAGFLLVRSKKDMAWFRKQTRGRSLSMVARRCGFPNCEPLPYRRNIILSRQIDFTVRGAEVCNSVAELARRLTPRQRQEVMVIGGAEIYRLLLPGCERAIITRFDKVFEADTDFPNLDMNDRWELVWQDDRRYDIEADIFYQFNIYRQKNMLDLEALS